jgi:O-antigen ligase
MRFYQLLWEVNHYRQGHRDASGHTFRMKLEFWRISLKIIKQHPLTGVGIGDVPDAFRKAYQLENSWLGKEWWMTSHNQYLYIAVAAGIPGLIIFLLFLLGPVFSDKRIRSYPPFIVFIIIALISMFTEDTLTTQAGVTFVVFFYSVFLFLRPSAEAASTTTDQF